MKRFSLKLTCHFLVRPHVDGFTLVLEAWLPSCNSDSSRKRESVAAPIRIVYQLIKPTFEDRLSIRTPLVKQSL